MANTYTFHSDPGHAWLEVPLPELKALGVAAEISTFSYINGNTAYLEEDCDAGLFINAMRLTGRVVVFAEQHKEVTPIRGYAPFSSEALR